jgi:hypothetical protein
MMKQRMIGALVLVCMFATAKVAGATEAGHQHGLDLAPHMRSVAIDVEKANIAANVDVDMLEEAVRDLRITGRDCDSVQWAITVENVLLMSCNRQFEYGLQVNGNGTVTVETVKALAAYQVAKGVSL